MTRPTREEVEKLDTEYQRRKRTPAGKRIDYTARAKALLEAGRHPLTKAPLLGGDQTCGDCAHFQRVHKGKVYFKCAYFSTNSEATDIRKGWPACDRFEE